MTVVLPKAGGGCAIASLLRRFSELTASGNNVADPGGVVLVGLASDDVIRMELFLAGGRHHAVPLKDNAFFAAVRASDYPVNLVGAVLPTRMSSTLLKPMAERS